MGNHEERDVVLALEEIAGAGTSRESLELEPGFPADFPESTLADGLTKLEVATG